MNYYPYRLVFPRNRRQGMSGGEFLDKELPFIALVGDIIDIDQGVFRVCGTARMAFCDETMLFLERW